METQYVCEKCGGKNIQIKAWIDPNTDKKVEDLDSIVTEDMWCNDCKDFVRIEPEDGYSDEQVDSGDALSESWFSKADDKTERERNV